MATCGEQGTHWYHEGDTCDCGQVPKIMFFSTPCSCGADRFRKPVHNSDCAYVKWGIRYNRWLKEHPELNPPLDEALYKVKETAPG